MHKKNDLNIEQMRLNTTYRQLNQSMNPSYYSEKNETDTSHSYWSFFKLRIFFSILFLFFIFACSKSIHTTEAKKISSIFSYIDKTDPYTRSVLKHLSIK